MYTTIYVTLKMPCYTTMLDDNPTLPRPLLHKMTPAVRHLWCHWRDTLLQRRCGGRPHPATSTSSWSNTGSVMPLRMPCYDTAVDNNPTLPRQYVWHVKTSWSALHQFTNAQFAMPLQWATTPPCYVNCSDMSEIHGKHFILSPMPNALLTATLAVQCLWRWHPASWTPWSLC